MLVNEEYKAKKAEDMKWAEGIVADIKASKDRTVKYKDSRPITDLKHMIETSAELYGDHTVFYQKFKKGEKYQQITYKKMLERVNGLGTALIDLGLQDKRIAVIGENCSQWAVAYLSVMCGVGTVVPLDKELSLYEVKQLVELAEVSCVIFTKKYEKMFRTIKNTGETVIKTLININAEEDHDDVLAFEPLIEKGNKLIAAGNRDFLDAQIDSDKMSALLFTSGTTGVSKGVMLSHKNICADLMAAPTVLKVNDWDIFFSVLPIHHTYECTCGFLMPLYKGAAIAYCEGLKYITKNLEEVKPTMFLGVPVLFEKLYKKIWQNVRKQGKEKTLLKVMKVNKKTKKIGIDLGNVFFKQIRAVFGGRMRMMICGGAAINPEVLEGIQAFGIMALQGYGLTECAPMGALNPDTAPKATSVGKAFPSFDVKVENKDDDGIGELCLKGDNVMMGYYNMPEATAEVKRDGWFYTGDLGYVDSEGYVYITGRKKNVIITKNGKNVFPEELEYYLSNVDIVEESMVYAQDSEDGEDTVIVAAIKLDEEEMRERYPEVTADQEREKLLWNEVDKINATAPYFKKIKKVVLRKEEFEKNTSKKIKRFAEGNKQ